MRILASCLELCASKGNEWRLRQHPFYLDIRHKCCHYSLQWLNDYFSIPWAVSPIAGQPEVLIWNYFSAWSWSTESCSACCPVLQVDRCLHSPKGRLCSWGIQCIRCSNHWPSLSIGSALLDDAGLRLWRAIQRKAVTEKSVPTKTSEHRQTCC